MEQRAVIKFNFKLGKMATETYKSMKIVYGYDCLSRSKVFEWYNRFKNGRESLEDDARSGRPTTSLTDANVERIRELLVTDRHLTCRMIAEKLNIAKTVVHDIIRNVLKKKKVCAKFVPHSLTPEQKEQRVNACRNLIEMADEDNTFLQKIITGDESWCFQYEPTTKRQSAEWLSTGEPRPTKVRMTKSKTKVMLITFFDAQGIIYKEFVPQGTTVNSHYYLDVLKRLCNRIRRVLPERWTEKDFFLLHDNAPAHTAGIVTQFLARKQIPVLQHPPYSPDLAPCDFFLFPKLKLHMKGERYDDIKDIQTNVTRELKKISSEEISNSFKWLYERCHRCIDDAGDYVEHLK